MGIAALLMGGGAIVTAPQSAFASCAATNPQIFVKSSDFTSDLPTATGIWAGMWMWTRAIDGSCGFGTVDSNHMTFSYAQNFYLENYMQEQGGSGNHAFKFYEESHFGSVNLTFQELTTGCTNMVGDGHWFHSMMWADAPNAWHEAVYCSDGQGWLGLGTISLGAGSGHSFPQYGVPRGEWETGSLSNTMSGYHGYEYYRDYNLNWMNWPGATCTGNAVPSVASPVNYPAGGSGYWYVTAGTGGMTCP
jgi:hypothetical protein